MMLLSLLDNIIYVIKSHNAFTFYNVRDSHLILCLQVTIKTSHVGPCCLWGVSLCCCSWIMTPHLITTWSQGRRVMWYMPSTLCSISLVSQLHIPTHSYTFQISCLQKSYFFILQPRVARVAIVVSYVNGSCRVKFNLFSILHNMLLHK